jgi:2-oxoisovalerate dehydrogenase E1 component
LLKELNIFKISNFKILKNPVVVCSLGDNSVTEGEVAKLFNLQHSSTSHYFLVQDNEWGIM